MSEGNFGFGEDVKANEAEAIEPKILVLNADEMTRIDHLMDDESIRRFAAPRGISFEAPFKVVTTSGESEQLISSPEELRELVKAIHRSGQNA